MVMHGKVCLVTGATSGIGKAVAAQLARMGATVVIVGRDSARTEATAREVGASDFLVANLASLADVRELATEFQRRHDRLHVLINCAGVIYGDRRVTPDGFEEGLAVNHLSHFLLTNLLLDTLKASVPARVVTVTSGFHKRGRIHFEDLQLEQKYSGTASYGQSKLANVLFTYELARRLAGTGVSAVCMTPGPVATNFGAKWGLNGLFFRVFGPFFPTPEKGAGPLAYLASAPELEEVTSCYFRKRQPAKSSKVSYEAAVQSRLWDVSERLTGLQGGGHSAS